MAITRTAAIVTASRAALGSGLLVLPFVFRVTGPGLAVSLLFACVLLAVTSLNMVVRVALYRGVHSLPTLARVAFGKVGEVTTVVSVCLYTAGCLVGILAMLGDVVPRVVHLVADMLPAAARPADDGSLMLLCTDRALILLVSAVGAAYLGSFDSVVSLGRLSSFSLYANLAFCLLLGYDALLHPDPRVHVEQLTVAHPRVFLREFPIISTSFVTHHMILPIVHSMAEEQQRKGSSVVIAAAQAIVGVFCGAVGTFGFLIGRGAHQSVLQDVHVEGFASLGVLCMFTSSLLFSAPMNIYPARDNLLALMSTSPHHHRLRASATGRLVFAAVFAGLCCYVAIIARNLDAMFGIIGSAFGTMIAYVIPAALYAQLAWEVAGSGDAHGAAAVASANDAAAEAAIAAADDLDVAAHKAPAISPRQRGSSAEAAEMADAAGDMVSGGGGDGGAGGGGGAAAGTSGIEPWRLKRKTSYMPGDTSSTPSKRLRKVMLLRTPSMVPGHNNLYGSTMLFTYAQLLFGLFIVVFSPLAIYFGW